jgi:hypothetical protein
LNAAGELPAIAMENQVQSTGDVTPVRVGQEVGLKCTVSLIDGVTPVALTFTSWKSWAMFPTTKITTNSAPALTDFSFLRVEQRSGGSVQTIDNFKASVTDKGGLQLLFGDVSSQVEGSKLVVLFDASPYSTKEDGDNINLVATLKYHPEREPMTAPWKGEVMEPKLATSGLLSAAVVEGSQPLAVSVTLTNSARAVASDTTLRLKKSHLLEVVGASIVGGAALKVTDEESDWVFGPLSAVSTGAKLNVDIQMKVRRTAGSGETIESSLVTRWYSASVSKWANRRKYESKEIVLKASTELPSFTVETLSGSSQEKIVSDRLAVSYGFPVKLVFRLGLVCGSSPTQIQIKFPTEDCFQVLDSTVSGKAAGLSLTPSTLPNTTVSPGATKRVVYQYDSVFLDCSDGIPRNASHDEVTFTVIAAVVSSEATKKTSPSGVNIPAVEASLHYGKAKKQIQSLPFVIDEPRLSLSTAVTPVRHDIKEYEAGDLLHFSMEIDAAADVHAAAYDCTVGPLFDTNVLEFVSWTPSASKAVVLSEAEALEQVRGGHLSLNRLPPGAHFNATLVLRVRQGVSAGATYHIQSAILRWNSFSASRGLPHHPYSAAGVEYTLVMAAPTLDVEWKPAGVSVGEIVEVRARVHLPKATTATRMILTLPNMQMVNSGKLSVSSQVDRKSGSVTFGRNVTEVESQANADVRKLQKQGNTAPNITLDFGKVVTAGSGVNLIVSGNFTLRDVPMSVREKPLGAVSAELQYGSKPSKLGAIGSEVVVQEPRLKITAFSSLSSQDSTSAEQLI